MPEALRVDVEASNKRQSRSCPPKGTSVHVILPFELFLRAIWPSDQHRRKKYMRLTGAKESTAKHRVSGKRNPSYEEIVAILRGDFGGDWIEHAMGDANPTWYRTMRRARNIGALRRQVAEQNKRLQQLELDVE